jgi:RNA polymerase sigma-70 factor, ECF subfamily
MSFVRRVQLPASAPPSADKAARDTATRDALPSHVRAATRAPRVEAVPVLPPGASVEATPLPVSGLQEVRSPEESGAIPIGSIDWGAEAQQARLKRLFTEHIDFVWRSLRTLGVPVADCDDGCQKVWCVVARKLSLIEADKERSFIFSVVVRVASDMRRSSAARNVVAPLEHELVSVEPDAEELLDRQRARDLLEQMLTHLPWDQRVVFVMFEIEGLGVQEIAEALVVPRGTVASRLRLAREVFNRALQRHCQRAHHNQASAGAVSPRVAGERPSAVYAVSSALSPEGTGAAR